jgi:hypothetical protein
MKCYYHQDRDAVALCKACNRGLCAKCAVDVFPGTACRSRCEDEVAAINLAVERSKTGYQKTATTYRSIGWLTIIPGSVMCIFGLIAFLGGNKSGAAVLLLFGFFGVLYGMSMFRSGKRIEMVEDNKKIGA